MHILLINQFYPPDTAATGQLLADLAEHLAARGHHVHVLTSRRAYAGGRRQYPPYELRHGVHVHRIPASGFGRATLLGRAADYLSFYLLACHRALTLPRMDLCVALTTPPFIALVGLLLRRLRRTRLSLWTMDLYPEALVAFDLLKPRCLLHRLLAALARRLYRRCDSIISLGEVMTRRLHAAGAAPHQITTIDNWVPAESISPIAPHHSRARRRWHLDDTLTVMYSGNLGRGHELDTLLHAAALLPDRRQLRLVFVGHGAMRQPLEHLAARLRLDCVRFYPPQPLHRLADTLAAADIHLISQRPGTQGIIVPSKLYGVLAAARPALFIGPPDTEAARILLAADAGLITPPGDIPAAALALDTLLQNPQLRATFAHNAHHYYHHFLGRHRSLHAITTRLEHPQPPQPLLTVPITDHNTPLPPRPTIHPHSPHPAPCNLQPKVKGGMATPPLRGHE